MALNRFSKPIILFTLSWGGHNKQAMPEYMIGVIKQTIDKYIMDSAAASCCVYEEREQG
ncbi:MAG: hypothetical protein IPF72_18290 [Chitinophagaceae bacterium]|nr:hypothetical protein [Chitinophagaceae bacterium]